MRNTDLYTFFKGLEMSDFKHPRVTHAINKNKRLVAAEIEDMEKAIEPSKKIKEFSAKKEEINKKYAVKNKDGTPKVNIVPDQSGNGYMKKYDVPGADDPKSKYSKEIDVLNKEYAEEIKERSEQVRKWNEEFLQEESSFSPFMLKLETLEDYEKECPQKVMDMIYWMIAEE